MSSEAFKSIFRPKGIAVWIAPTASEPIPLLARNILAGGYQGRVVLLGSGQEPPAPLERRDGPGQPGPGLELLLFRGDISELANALPALGRAGLKAAVVYSPPPADETGLKSLLAAARDAGIRLVGPGSWGVVNTAVNLLAVADRPKLKPGQLALITQSKVVCCYMLAEAAKRGIGLGLALDLGAEADLGQDEALDYLAHHYQAKAVGLHLGRVKRPARLVSSALAASREKPVLALKAWEDPEPEGLSAAGRFPAPGPEEAWNAVLRRAGVPLMESLGSLLSSADLAARLGACRGPHVLLLSESVGAAGLALEALTHRGLLPARLDGTSADRLAGLGCQTGVRQGLALLPPEGGQGLLREAATVCLRTYGVDAILAMPAPDPENGAGDLAGALAQAMAACRAGEALRRCCSPARRVPVRLETIPTPVDFCFSKAPKRRWRPMPGCGAVLRPPAWQRNSRAAPWAALPTTLAGPNACSLLPAARREACSCPNAWNCSRHTACRWRPPKRWPRPGSWRRPAKAGAIPPV